MRRSSLLLFIVMMLVTFVGFAVVNAQDASQDVHPAQVGEDIRQRLFNAQSAVMGGDSAEAIQAVSEARDLYDSVLRPAFAQVDDTLATRLDALFDDAHTAAVEGNSPALAAARGQLWTGILHGSGLVVYDALAQNEIDTARTWLALREYRLSTRFSRPGADATLALNHLMNGTINPDDALAAVSADLLDTYQSQLNKALADADDAHTRGFTMRRAEEAGMVAGYFDILADAYAGQHGEQALADARSAFQQLAQAAQTGDASLWDAARADADAILSGFRAAPLSAEEQARRAGQLLRFVALVPVEYARGVRNGIVTNDIEIQEALTFHQGAVAAFADLRSTLAQTDSAATDHVAGLLETVRTQIGGVAEPSALEDTVDEIRSVLEDLMPEAWLSSNASSDVDVIVAVLDQVEAAAAQGEYGLAESSRLEAYALLELGLEQRLRGFAPDRAVQIESLFWQGTRSQQGLAVLLANEAPIEEVRAGLNQLEAALTEAQAFLGAANSAPAAIAGNAAIIVFREGLEAVVILASLLASLRTAEARQFRRPLVIGAVLAFAATAVTWWFAHMLLEVLMPYGEKLEAIVSLIAIGLLLLITNWFFHKVYWTGWMAGFHAHKRKLIGGMAVITISQSAGLVILGFSSIYREGFETVLFLQSLVLDAGIGTVLQGVALGLLGVALVGSLTFALQVRLPYKKMLIVTGVLISMVLLTMVGNTVHVMQSVGWLPITPIQGVYIPYWAGQWFGLFATWQGIGLQIVAAAFVIGSYYLAEYRTASRRKPVEERAAAA